MTTTSTDELRGLPLLAGLDDAQLTELAAAGEQVELAPDDVAFPR